MRQNADMTVFFANENTCDCESRIDGEYCGQNKRLIARFFTKNEARTWETGLPALICGCE